MLGFQEEGASSESNMNIVKLSSSLSAFVEYPSSTLEFKLRATYISSIRRALCFTLYRNYDLASRVFEDLIEQTLNVEGQVGSALSWIRRNFENSRFRLFNRCFIDDLSAFEASISSGEWKLVGQKLLQVMSSVKKTQLGFNLEEIEEAAKAYIEDLN
jgi:hypothetical protein